MWAYRIPYPRTILKNVGLLNTLLPNHFQECGPTEYPTQECGSTDYPAPEPFSRMWALRIPYPEPFSSRMWAYRITYSWNLLWLFLTIMHVRGGGDGGVLKNLRDGGGECYPTAEPFSSGATIIFATSAHIVKCSRYISGIYIYIYIYISGNLMHIFRRNVAGVNWCVIGLPNYFRASI